MRWWKRLKAYLKDPRPTRDGPDLPKLPLSHFYQMRIVRLFCSYVDALAHDDDFVINDVTTEAWMIYNQYIVTDIYMDLIKAIMEYRTSSSLWEDQRYYAFRFIPRKIDYITRIWKQSTETFNIHELTVCAQFDDVTYWKDKLYPSNPEAYAGVLAQTIYLRENSQKILASIFQVSVKCPDEKLIS